VFSIPVKVITMAAVHKYCKPIRGRRRIENEMLLDSANDDGCVSLIRAAEDRNTEKGCQKPVLQQKTTNTRC